MKILKLSPGSKPMKPITAVCWCCEARLKVDYADLTISFNGSDKSRPNMFAKFICPCCEQSAYVQLEKDLKKIYHHYLIQQKEAKK